MEPVLAINAGGDADLGLIRDVAAGQQVSIGAALLAAVRQRREQALRALRDGQPVYGVNTGMGALSSVRLTERQQRSHQRNLLLARATGGPPWLSPPEARAVITTRLLTFLSGDAAVSGELCQRLADFLNQGLAPAIPRGGNGSAGEIMPLAHAFGPVAGIGQVLGLSGYGEPGSGVGAVLVPARDALRRHGLTEFPLGPKEGIALIQGVPGATGLCALRLGEATALAGLMEAAAALSIAVIRAPRDPYRAACGRGDDVLAAVLGRLRAAAGDEPSPRSLQAPVSFRVAGPALAQVQRAAALLEAAAHRALAGVTDSPAYLDGQFTGTAGFHGIDLAAHCDQLTAAFCHAAEVAAARLHRLMEPAVTGLPAQLAREPGPQAGLTPVHKRAAGEVHAMRRLAVATPVGLIETSGGQEDVQAFAWEAAEKLRAALRQARAVTACELLAGYQAAALAADPVPGGCRTLLDWLAGIVGPIDSDRPFGEDIERLVQAPWPSPGPDQAPMLTYAGGTCRPTSQASPQGRSPRGAAGQPDRAFRRAGPAADRRRAAPAGGRGPSGLRRDRHHSHAILRRAGATALQRRQLLPHLAGHRGRMCRGGRQRRPARGRAGDGGHRRHLRPGESRGQTRLAAAPARPGRGGGP